MYIDKIEINGFCTFNNFTLNLDKKMNIIVGMNGVGKSQFLNLIHMALDLNNYQELKNYINDSKHEKEKYIKIHLKFDKNELDFINKLYGYTILHNIFKQNTGNKFPNQEELCDFIQRIDKFNGNNLIIECSYGNNMIMKRINVKGTKCHEDYYLDVDLQIDTGYNSHKYGCKDEGCLIRQFLILVSNKNCAREENTYIQTTFINRFIIPFYKFNMDYLNRMIILFNSFICMTGSKINLINTYNDIMYQNIFNIDDLIKIYICDSVHNLFKSEYIPIDEIIDITNIPHTVTINKCEKALLREKIYKINPHYQTRYLLHLIKNEEYNKYLNIKEKFKSITNKEFDIRIVDNDMILDDYEYCIQQDSNYYLCSNGESELIDFLCSYINSENYSIVFIDEPCTKLASQKKHGLKKLFMDDKSNKQHIIITHDIELIDKNYCKQIIHFRLEDGVTKFTSLIDLEKDEIKMIYENPKILFSDKILLVEGYSDSILMEYFLKHHQIMDYQIIISGGCGSKIHEILDKIKIKYKIIYDLDKFLTKEGNPKKFIVANKTIKFIKDRIKSELEKENIHEMVKQLTIRELHDDLDRNSKDLFYEQMNKILIEINNGGLIFIIPPPYNDLEGIGKILFDDSFVKKDWENKTNLLEDKIIETKHELFDNILNFLKMDIE